MTQLAACVRASRPTAYQWVYQLGLAGLVGIRASEGRPEGVVAEEPSPALETVSASVKLPEALWRAARIEALQRRQTASALVAEALRAYLAEPRRSASTR